MIVVLRWRNLRAAVVAFLLRVHCIYITSLPLPFMEGSRLPTTFSRFAVNAIP